MAGVSAARHLLDAGFQPVLFDKGRRPGGRMATRTIGEARFDHGTQHFSVRSKDFADVIARLEPGVVRRCFHSQSVTTPGRGVEPRHVGGAGMRSIVETLAEGLDVRLSSKITRLRLRPDGVELQTDNGFVANATTAVVTPPLPQTLELLSNSNIDLPRTIDETLSEVEYEACLAVMARLDGPGGLESGHASFHEGPIAWIGDNHHKGISGVPAVTIHSTGEYAEANLESDTASWTLELAEAAADVMGAKVLEATPHRWRLSRPVATLDIGAMRAWPGSPIVLAGEAFYGARVEGAFLSGKEAARLIVETH